MKSFSLLIFALGINANFNMPIVNWYPPSNNPSRFGRTMFRFNPNCTIRGPTIETDDNGNSVISLGADASDFKFSRLS
jgi:hypothetical protein